MPGNGTGGRTEGAKDRFPRNSYKAMKELIAGRIMKTLKDQEGQEVQKLPAEIMAEAILEGMEGKLILSHNQYGEVIANPLHAVKLYQDYMLRARELAIRVAELKKKEKGVWRWDQDRAAFGPGGSSPETRSETSAPQVAGAGSLYATP